MYLLKGDLPLALENLNYTGILREFQVYSIPEYNSFSRTGIRYRFLLIRNLYFIFSKLDFSLGKDILRKKFKDAYRVEKELIIRNYHNHIKGKLEHELSKIFAPMLDWESIDGATQEIDLYTPVSYEVLPSYRGSKAAFYFTYSKEHFFMFDEILELWGETPSTEGLDILLLI